MAKKLRRSEERMLGGVLGGIADYFDLDHSLVRIGYVLFSVLSAGFPGLIVYLLMLLIIPNDIRE